MAMGRAFWGLVAVLAALGVAAPAARAALTVPFSTFSGANASTAPAMAAFDAAAGGGDNATTPGEQGSGFRHFIPAGIAVDGSDPGSTAIPGGHTAALSRTRLQPWGIRLGPAVAVANDGFKSVNSHAGFSPPDLWAPFNSNMTELEIVAPAAETSTPVPALTRGLGIVFMNVGNAGTTIQYYSGNALLDQVTAPQGPTSFAGLLFRDPVVTRVVVTLATAKMFSFDGSTVSPGGTDPTTLVAGDDVVLAEPGAGQATLAATAGVPTSPVLESFDSNDSASQITATIDWGDGTRSSGSIIPATGGGFEVTGSHSFALPGTYTAKVTVDDFSGSELRTNALVRVAQRPTSTSLACSPAPVTVSAGTMCTAIVVDSSGPGATAPTGLVTFSTPTPGAAFGQDRGCMLGPTATPGLSACAVRFIPGQLPPIQARVAAAYGGDAAHAASGATATVGVRAQRCSLQALTRRLRPGGLGILVTCDAQSGVQAGVKAQVARRGRFRAFSLQYGSLRGAVTAGRPTVLVIKPEKGVLKALRGGLRHHQRVSLKVTLTASSHATSRTTTTRVSALRIS
jgi:hypothetical protein